MIVVVTRPEPGNARTCAALEQAGITAVAAPLFDIRGLSHTLPTKCPDALLVSSSNAVRHLDARDVQRLAACPLFAVGAATAETARMLGFQNVVAGSSDLAALTLSLRAALRPGSFVLRLAAPDRNDEALLALAEHVNIETVLTYEAAARDAWPDALHALAARAEPCIVLHFSRRAATVFETLSTRCGHQSILTDWVHVCVSGMAVLPAFRTSFVAETPTEAAMIALAQNLTGRSAKI